MLTRGRNVWGVKVKASASARGPGTAAAYAARSRVREGLPGQGSAVRGRHVLPLASGRVLAVSAKELWEW